MCAEAIAGFTAEAMSAQCAVPAEQIRQLARDFAAADKAVCYGRMGVSTQAFGTLCHWLVQLINLVTGNLDRTGGALCTSPAVDLVASTSGGHFNRVAKPGFRASGIWRRVAGVGVG